MRVRITDTFLTIYNKVDRCVLALLDGYTIHKGRGVQSTARGPITARDQISCGLKLHFYNILFMAC